MKGLQLEFGTMQTIISDDFQTRSGVARSSTEVDTCLVPRTPTLLADRSFTVAGPRLSNSLPTTLRRSDTGLGEFKRLSKTHLIRVAKWRRVATVFTVCRV